MIKTLTDVVETTPEATNNVAEVVTKVVEHVQQYGAWYLVGLLAVGLVITLIATGSKSKVTRRRK